MDEQAIDMEVISCLRELGGDDDPGLVNELIDLFLDDASTRVESLLKAMQEEDLDELVQIAHALKSASANLGAMTLSVLCREIEQKARDGDEASAITPLVEQADSAFADARSALCEIRSSES